MPPTSKEPTVDETKTTLIKELEQFEPDVFWEKHGKQVIAGTVAVLVVIVGLLMWQRQQQSGEEQEALKLSQAVDITRLEQFVNSSGSKSLVPMALMRLGDLHFREGRYAEAGTTYQKLVDIYPRSSFVAGARFSLAAIQEAQGQFEAARGLYSQLAGGTSGYAGYQARLGVARCTEALGQTKEARQLYEELLMAGQMSGGQSLPMVRWAVLGRSQPASVAATNNTSATQTTIPQLLK
jgi:predicted negative regulator of RcsB-dependent stress response